jgi:hypothetical protein
MVAGTPVRVTPPSSQETVASDWAGSFTRTRSLHSFPHNAASSLLRRCFVAASSLLRRCFVAASSLLRRGEMIL